MTEHNRTEVYCLEPGSNPGNGNARNFNTSSYPESRAFSRIFFRHYNDIVQPERSRDFKSSDVRDPACRSESYSKAGANRERGNLKKPSLDTQKDCHRQNESGPFLTRSMLHSNSVVRDGCLRENQSSGTVEYSRNKEKTFRQDNSLQADNHQNHEYFMDEQKSSNIRSDHQRHYDYSAFSRRFLSQYNNEMKQELSRKRISPPREDHYSSEAKKMTPSKVHSKERMDDKHSSTTVKNHEFFQTGPYQNHLTDEWRTKCTISETNERGKTDRHQILNHPSTFTKNLLVIDARHILNRRYGIGTRSGADTKCCSFGSTSTAFKDTSLAGGNNITINLDGDARKIVEAFQQSSSDICSNFRNFCENIPTAEGKNVRNTRTEFSSNRETSNMRKKTSTRNDPSDPFLYHNVNKRHESTQREKEDRLKIRDNLIKRLNGEANKIIDAFQQSSSAICYNFRRFCKNVSTPEATNARKSNYKEIYMSIKANNCNQITSVNRPVDDRGTTLRQKMDQAKSKDRNTSSRLPMFDLSPSITATDARHIINKRHREALLPK